ncbi:unnamed protein product [Caenorhabditis angaria]|uniref:Probable RNA polymerase II nuclear localization protein SLC7A6OS n=1 Tax=Caenorhabditis angaria TaxID=860376 RepID=A0A9P1MV46_9PELO|nr:unnamed protein product [Caenorhabditis angaria]
MILPITMSLERIYATWNAEKYENTRPFLGPILLMFTMNQVPLIRVSRKRNADPHEALIVQCKKIKQADPVVYTLFKTKDSLGNDDVDLDGIHVVDFPVSEEGSSSNQNPLGFVENAIGEVGEAPTTSRAVEREAITLNGQVMVPIPVAAPIAAPDANDLVFDYYRVNSSNDRNIALYSNKFLETNALSQDAFDVRFASRYEADLVNHESDDDSDVRADDDDDSNDEDNWRNEYPDEDSYDENDSDDGDYNYYGECRSDVHNHREDAFPDESMQRRLQNIAISDSYDTYFEGEETDDEDDS